MTSQLVQEMRLINSFVFYYSVKRVLCNSFNSLSLLVKKDQINSLLWKRHLNKNTRLGEKIEKKSAPGSYSGRVGLIFYCEMRNGL